MFNLKQIQRAFDSELHEFTQIEALRKLPDEDQTILRRLMLNAYTAGYTRAITDRQKLEIEARPDFQGELES